MKIEKTPKLVPSSTPSMGTRHSVDIFRRPLLKRAMICQNFNSVRAYPRLVFFGGTNDCVGLLLTGDHCICVGESFLDHNASG